MKDAVNGEVTLKMVGEACGCSATTVSQALRGTGKVSALRRNTIIDVAQRMGYHRNASAAVLRGHRRVNEDGHGMPVVFIERKEAVPYLTHKIIQAIGEHAHRMGYKLEQRRYADTAELIALLRELTYRRVDVILLGNIEGDVWAEGVDWSPFVVLGIWRFGYSYPFHAIRYNYFQALRQLFARSYELGYKRIGLVCLLHEPVILDDASRQAAVDEANRLYKDRAHILPPLYYQSYLGAERLAEWLKANNPDMIIGFNSGVYNAMKSLGKRIPEDYAYCSLLDTAENQAAIRSTGFLVEHDKIGGLVVTLIDAFLRQNRRGMLEFVTETLMTMKFLQGETMPAKTGCPMAET
ncbi:MAG: LacI family DNA-binding transcriptional regulator [Verrucomicrobiota bacterium]|nr:LacI family DNA-binding transcriptional regulator [Verrucomicrobiota bacterium]